MTLLSSPVCVARNECYSDNNGAWVEFIIWDGEKVYTEGGVYADLSLNSYSVNATKEEKQAASDWVQANEIGAYGRKTIGCAVVFKRSRLVPNKVQFVVVDWIDSHWGSYGKEPQKLVVVHNGQRVAVSAEYIVVKGACPWWNN